MYARIATTDIKDGKANELVQTIQEKALPSYENMPGFAGSMVLIDEQNQKGVMLTLWNSKEDLEASEKQASHRGHLDEYRETPQVGFYEVKDRR